MNWCRFHRWVASRRLDDGGTLPARVQRHLDGCAECRAHYERERRCADALVAQAARMQVPAPPFLRQRVLANLEAWDSQRPAGLPWPVRWWTLTSSVAAILVGFWLLVWPRPESDTPRHRSLPPEALAALDSIPSGTTFLDLGAQLDAPLQGEWDSVVLDARNALASLERSFIPGEREEHRR